LAEISV